MKKNLYPESLLYVEEHVVCTEYVSGKDAGFNKHVLQKGESFQILPENSLWNMIYFFLEGDVDYVIGNFGSKQVANLGEMIFVPKRTNFECMAVKETHFISHIFEKPLSLCDKFAMQSLYPYCKSVKSSKERLPIQKPLRDFLDLLDYYLKIGMMCKHMHNIKQKELFLLMRVFYTKEENAAFFYPIISKNMDFKSIVYDNYQRAKTLQELASLCNLSLATFNRLFNDNFQETPYNWMQKQKAKQIAGYLSNKEILLSDIISKFDFSSAAHFTIFCKKYLNMTPTKYRMLSASETEKRIDSVFKK